MDTFEKDFGSLCFSDSVMRQYLPIEVYNALKRNIDGIEPLSLETANAVAEAMMHWAVSKGATHYCHWFMPMTDLTSEKHDSFLTAGQDGYPILEFSGKNLLKGESDASSFPSGGLRATFEARGYTTWDCTSWAFVREGSLYIPTAFCSYNGEALDKKTPLLRSMDAISAAAVRMLNLCGETEVKRVIPNVGAEQEYFLIDKEVYVRRKDLILTGRTLIGKLPPKGQDLADHYAGSLRKRVSEYMQELDRELWKLGVYAHTRHNESAPAQHELAPVYEIVNIAADHNYLTMTLMKRIAEKHGFVCLLHEKPFNGVNGSGKHNNWSLSADNGLNLLDPGKDIKENKIFLLTLAAVIDAVNRHADLLRMSIATAGNDVRLGSGEAPPAIISIYLGDELTYILEQIKTGGSSKRNAKSVNLDVKSMPSFMQDSTDRNRTSPFAFTGNKFEFRMVGSNSSLGTPNTILNSIVAESMNIIGDRLEKSRDTRKEIDEIIKEYAVKNERIIYNGNNYSKQWREEAARRGLKDIRTTAEALEILKDKKTVKMFGDTKVYSEAETNSRYESLMDQYCKTIKIEGAALSEIIRQDIIPASNRYLSELAKCGKNLIKVNITADYLYSDIKKIISLTESLYLENDALCKLLAALKGTADITKRGHICADEIIPKMAQVRALSDELESIIPADSWPMPGYVALLYSNI